MRHRHGFRKLNITDGAHRRAMMRHIGNALIEHEQINTTLPRAKELRRFIEPLITLGKKPTVHNRRLAFARLQNRQSVTKLFDELGARFSPRPGGYVRILKHGFRKGDSAPMALVEFVDKAPEVDETAAASVATDKKSKPTKKAAAKTKTVKADKSDINDKSAPTDKGGEESVTAAGAAEVTDKTATKTESDTPPDDKQAAAPTAKDKV